MNILDEWRETIRLNVLKFRVIGAAQKIQPIIARSLQNTVDRPLKNDSIYVAWAGSYGSRFNLYFRYVPQFLPRYELDNLELDRIRNDLSTKLNCELQFHHRESWLFVICLDLEIPKVKHLLRTAA